MADDSAFLAGPFDPPALLMFAAVEIALAGGGFLRLVDGSGQVSFTGRTFIGQDPQLGVLAGLDAITDGFGDTAPGLRLTINPPDADGASILGASDMQGRSVLLWVGVIATATGAPVAPPVLVFIGEVDQGVINVGMGTRRIDLDCVSIWERLFDDAEGVRLSNSFHQSAWPGELGFEFATDVQRQLPWGQDLPRPAAISDGNSQQQKALSDGLRRALS